MRSAEVVNFELMKETLFELPQTNAELNLALEFVKNTGHNIFLTGKAGTGKTTFLHYIKQNLPKRMVVVAPTGVAAINAGGVTIHSFFQLAFAPYIPGTTQGESRTAVRKFRREKIRLIQSLDLLVIDEISMVRADLLDAIDDVLRRYRFSNKPFGGVQLLMIGDLHQLAPVAKDEEWSMLAPYYETIFFFSSNALKKTETISIELSHIFHQSDAVFIDLLEKIRTRQITPEVLEMLNSRYQPDFIPDEDEGYITLTTHNAHATEMNHQRLSMIEDQAITFKAIIKDDFPTYSYPTDYELELKVGAQVMFVKNDLSQEKLFYNGKIGKIVSLSEDSVQVRCPGDELDIKVTALEWESLRYDLDEQSREIRETVTGSFIQLPLKLAWAITIHKSQGLTFDRAIIDARASFAHGQVYVALSRCRTFEGIILRSSVLQKSVITDSSISSFTEEVKQNQPDEKRLLMARIDYQHSLLRDLFGFQVLRNKVLKCLRIIQDNSPSLDPSVEKGFVVFVNETGSNIFDIAAKFNKQLDSLMLPNDLPEENAGLNERVTKAATYFAGKCAYVYDYCGTIEYDTDNALVRAELDEALESMRKEVFVKKTCLEANVVGFMPQELLKARTNADLDYITAKSKPVRKEKSAPSSTQHPALYKALKEWRDALAADSDTDEYKVLPYKTLVEISNKLPLSIEELKKIRGIGKVRASFFADDILGITRDYCAKQGLRADFEPERPKPKKISSEQTTYDLFRQGQTLDEIAAFRGLSEGTIASHLLKYVAKGEIRASELMSASKVQCIAELLHNVKSGMLSDIKAKLGDEYSYEEIRFVVEDIKRQKRAEQES